MFMHEIKNIKWKARYLPQAVFNITQDEHIEDTIKSILPFAKDNPFIIGYKNMFFGEVQKTDTVQSVMDFINSEKAILLSKTK